MLEVSEFYEGFGEFHGFWGGLAKTKKINMLEFFERADCRGSQEILGSLGEKGFDWNLFKNRGLRVEMLTLWNKCHQV